MATTTLATEFPAGWQSRPRDTDGTYELLTYERGDWSLRLTVCRGCEDGVPYALVLRSPTGIEERLLETTRWDRVIPAMRAATTVLTTVVP